MRVAQQQSLLALFEDYQGATSQVLAIAWLELNLAPDQLDEFRKIWFRQATIAVVPNSNSGMRVSSSEHPYS